MVNQHTAKGSFLNSKINVPLRGEGDYKLSLLLVQILKNKTSLKAEFP